VYSGGRRMLPSHRHSRGRAALCPQPRPRVCSLQRRRAGGCTPSGAPSRAIRLARYCTRPPCGNCWSGSASSTRRCSCGRSTTTWSSDGRRARCARAGRRRTAGGGGGRGAGATQVRGVVAGGGGGHHPGGPPSGTQRASHSSRCPWAPQPIWRRPSTGSLPSRWPCATPSRPCRQTRCMCSCFCCACARSRRPSICYATCRWPKAPSSPAPSTAGRSARSVSFCVTRVMTPPRRRRMSRVLPSPSRWGG